ncbi:MAG: trigger factor [Firmicutes bacterium]|nr:trigger factor [Bacillota bacterium]
MKTEFKGREGNSAKFTIEFTAEEFEAALQKAYLQDRGKISVDGFRKGKAPRSIIERKYGESIFFETAINNMVEEAYPKAVDELKLDTVDRPSLSFGDEKLEKGKGFTVTFDVTVSPEVELKKYKGLEVEFKPLVIGDDDVDIEVDNLRSRNARLVSVDREAQLGDTVVLDYAGFVGDDQFEGGTAEKFSLKLGSGMFIPGFEDQLVGIKAGEDRDVTVTFPEDYQAEQLAGKEAVFKCKVHEVQYEEFPELDDEFAKDVSEFDTLDELRKDIKEKLQKQTDEKNDYDGKNKAVLALCDANDIDIPEVMIQDELDQMKNDYLQRLVNQGVSADAVKKYLESADQTLNDNFRPDAVARVKSSLLIKAIAAKENIEATAEELDEEYQKYALMYNMELEKVKKALEFNEEYLKEDIVYRKTVNFVFDNAKIVEPKESEEKAE